MFFPYGILFVGCLAVQAESLSRAFVHKNQPRDNRAGFFLVNSCKPYQSAINQAFASIKEVAKAGYNQAVYQDRYYDWFFEPQHQTRVVEVLKNVVIATNGHGPTIRFTCEVKAPCIATPAALWYVGNSEYINICPKALEGEQALPIERDYCKPMRRITSTLTTVILHELIHSRAIGGNTRILDYGETLRSCLQLGKGLAKDQNGEKIEATSNANNYVLLSEQSMWISEQRDPAACAAAEMGRKLTGANGTDDSQEYGIIAHNETTSISSLITSNMIDEAEGNATSFLAAIGDYNIYPASENQSVAVSSAGDLSQPVVIQDPPNSQDLIQGE